MTTGEFIVPPQTFEQQYAAKLELVTAGTEQLSAALERETAAENHHIGAAVESYRSLLERGGKRTRGVLTATGYEIYQGDNSQVVSTAAAVVEAVHAGLLVVDDVADAASLRRNGPTVHTYLDRYFQQRQAAGNTKKLGEDVAQAGALYAMSRAQALLMELPTSPRNIVTAAHILSDGLARTSLGQMLDILASGCNDIEAKDVDTIATYKTAFYSYLLPLQLGGALAGAPEEELEHFRGYSLQAGFAFQMQDDVIGCFGDEAVTGKSSKSDISEGKKTRLMADALSNATDAQREILLSALGNSQLSDQHFQQCQEILVATGAYERTVALAQQYAQGAIASLAAVPAHWPTQQIQFLRDMAAFSVQRIA